MLYLYMRNRFTGLGHWLGCRDPSMDTWEYICNQSPPEALKTVRFHVRAKVLEHNGGAALNGEGIDLDFIGHDAVARIRFAKIQAGTRISVIVPDALREKTFALMAGLVSKRKIKPFEKPAAEIAERKPFTKASDILNAHMAKPDFTKHIEILPQALVHAEQCLYEHDGKLDKALTHLATFASKRAGKNIPIHRLMGLAKDSALGNLYRPMVSDTVVRVHGDHYRFEFNGKKCLFDEHITLGGGYPKECMSIHFIWDEARAKLVIGYFGQHLPTSMDK
jgi:hypothetical protein